MFSVKSDQVKMLRFYNVQTINLTFVGIKLKYTIVKRYSTTYHPIGSDTKYHKWCTL